MKEEFIHIMDAEKGVDIWIESKVHDHGIKFANVKIPAGMELLSATEAFAVYDNEQARKALELETSNNDFWIKQPSKVNEKNGFVAWFIANSERAFLYCSRNPQNSNSALGVLLKKKLNPLAKRSRKTK